MSDTQTPPPDDAGAAGARVRQGLKALASESVVYGLGQAGGRAVQLLLVPVLTRTLAPAAYGVSELVIGYLQTLILVLVLGMDGALARFFYQEPDAQAKQRMVSTSFWFRLTLGIAAAAAIGACAGPFAAQMIGAEVYRKYVLIGAAILPMTLLVMFGNDVLRVTFQPWKYIALNLAQTVAGTSLALWLVVRLQMGVAGALYGRLLGDALAAAFAVFLIRHHLRPTFSPHALRRMLAYGAPLLPALVFFGLITSIDRFALQRTRSLEDMAVYAVAMKFFTVLIFSASAFQLAYGPFAYARAGTPEAPRLYARALSLYLGVGLSGALWVSAFAPEALAVLAPPLYARAAMPALLLAFAAVAFGAYTVTGIGVGLALKTAWDGLCAGGAMLVAVAAQFFLTPRYGPTGAALATLSAYVTAAVLHYFVAQRFYPLPYQGARWLVMFAIANAAAVVLQQAVPHGASGLAIKLVAASLFTGVAMTMAMGRIPRWRAAGADR